MSALKSNRIRTSKCNRRPTDLRFSSRYGMILSVLSYTGINLFEDTRSVRRTVGICFSILIHLSSIDYWLMSYVNFTNKWEEYQLVLSFVFSNTLSLVLWHVLYWKRRSLRTLLEKMDSICDGTIVVSVLEKSILNCVIFFGVFVTPVVYSVLSVYLMTGPDPTHYYTFYTYGREVGNFTAAFNTYLFAKSVSSNLLDPVFTSCVIFVYCLLCHRSCRLLSGLCRRLARLQRGQALPPADWVRDLAGDYSRLCAVLERLQCLFSLPSFLLILVDTTSSFTILASAVLYSPEEVTGPLIAEIAFVFVTSALFLAVTIAFAAQVPVTMRGIRTRIQGLHEKVAVCGGRTDDVVVMLQAMKGRKAIVLSGCEIIYFTRTTILTALGTLLTYGLLIIQLK